MSRPALTGPAVVVDDVAKTFSVPHERVHTLKERALHPFRRSGDDRFEALKGISFAVEHGEFFGIVGRNGSGKSTLLKCLAGIYRPDRGSIRMRGRLSTFIELGVGFNPDLAARERPDRRTAVWTVECARTASSGVNLGSSRCGRARRR